MASVPISKAYVQKLTKTAGPSGKHKENDIQINDERVKVLRKSFFQSFYSTRKITGTYYDQAVRIYIEKKDS